MNKTISLTAAEMPCCPPPGKRDRTRIALIEAAIDVLAEKGLEGTSIDDLMRTAGMARGTFYNYFQTREELVCAVSGFIRENVYQAVVDRIPPHYNNEETFACVTYGFIHYGIQYPKTGWALVRIGGSTHWVTGERFQRAHNALEAVLIDPAPPFLGLIYIEGVALMVIRRLLENVIGIEEADTVITMAMRGVGISSERIPALLKTAKAFVDSINLHH
jgi:AcrR family transcriptional regulator